MTRKMRQTLLNLACNPLVVDLYDDLLTAIALLVN